MKFLAFWEENTPDAITGWNCELYDIPYICGRFERIIGQKETRRLSPWRNVRKKEFVVQGREQISYEIAGVSVIGILREEKENE